MKTNKLALILTAVMAVSVLCSCTKSEKGSSESSSDTKSIVLDSSAEETSKTSPVSSDEETSKAASEASADETSSDPISINADFSMLAVAEGKQIELTKEQQDEIFSLCVSQINDDNAIDSVYTDDTIYKLQGIWIKFKLNSPLEAEGRAGENINYCGGLTFVCMKNYGNVFCRDSYGLPQNTVTRICEILGYEFSAETGLVTKNESEYELSPEFGYLLTSDLSEITPEMTYGEIIEKFKLGANFGFEDRMMYVLDFDNILVLRYNSTNDVCGKSGQELAAEAVSRIVPEDARDKVFNDGPWYYGIMMDEHTFYTESHGAPQIIMVSFNQTENITYSDGSTADVRDLFIGRQCTPVLLEIDELLETYPAQAYPKNVVIY